ncbi:hypothetical protein VN97_g4720 [Penicillium thymicola]|uniref:Uncharacterized protein n=1 Tax=Penicillium thymicola TaxID=293382 RepID=A0AAI9TJR8_PENTH|nr:hypothetical protein VN97_g4720 [Penicillium thymicola]
MTSRLRAAYSRQQAQPSLLAQGHADLRGTESVIKVIHNQRCLETAAVTSELVEMKSLSQELLTLLERLNSGKKSTSRQFAYQLISGSKDEGHFDNIVKRMNSAKTNIILHVEVASVGLARDSQSNLVVNAAEIRQLDRTVRELLGDGRGLRIASLLKDRPLHEDGTVILDRDDLNRIGVSIPNGGNTRMIIGNLTRLQALQINGPVGEDEWKTISHIDIRDNEAGLASSQVNFSVSDTAFTSLMFDHTIKYVLLFALLFVLIYAALH